MMSLVRWLRCVSVMVLLGLAACQTDSRQQILHTDRSQVELRAVQTRAFDTTDRNLTVRNVIATLQGGTVTVSGPRAPGELAVVVEHQGRRIPAVFQQRSAADARREVAAFRLDRHLRLGIVPATVEREVQGQRGVLQARPAKWVTQADVQKQALRGGGSQGSEATQ